MFYQEGQLAFILDFQLHINDCKPFIFFFFFLKMLLHTIPYNYNFPHTCQISDRSQLVNSLTQLYNSSLPQMEILSIRLPPVLICSPPTISDEALIAIARLQLMIGVALKPQSWLSAVIGGMHWEADSGMEFTIYGID